MLQLQFLMCCCVAVEPKHLAAVLATDPVTPLVAIEAVIRHLDYRLDEFKHQHQHQHQKHESSAYISPQHDSATSTSPTSGTMADTRQQAATRYLRFVTHMMQAVQLMLQDERFCAQLAADHRAHQRHN